MCWKSTLEGSAVTHNIRSKRNVGLGAGRHFLKINLNLAVLKGKACSGRQELSHENWTGQGQRFILECRIWKVSVPLKSLGNSKLPSDFLYVKGKVLTFSVRSIAQSIT